MIRNLRGHTQVRQSGYSRLWKKTKISSTERFSIWRPPELFKDSPKPSPRARRANLANGFTANLWIPWMVLAAFIALGAIVYDQLSSEGIGVSPSESVSTISEEPINQHSKSGIGNSLVKPNISETRNDPTVWLVISIVLLAAATALSVGISFYLYRWRKLLLNRTEILVPEAWGGKLLAVDKSLTSLIGNFDDNARRLETASENNTIKLNDMIETFMTFQLAISERDREINRLKGGYDKDIFRRFLYRFIRVHQTIDVLQTGNAKSDDRLEMLRRLLEDAFTECGLEIYEPPLDEDYRNVEGIADNPVKETTMNFEDVFKIANVVEKGYRLTGIERSEVLIPAKVKIFVQG